MLLRKMFVVFLALFVLPLKSQSFTIKISSSENTVQNIEKILCQEHPFGSDTLALKHYLKPLSISKNYTAIYDGLLANGYADFYSELNTKSYTHYKQSIKTAVSLKQPSMEIWTKLNYVNYLYCYRDYLNMAPMLLQVIGQIEKIPADELYLAGESFKKIGWILQTLGDYDTSLYYLTLAKAHTTKNTSEYAAILDAIGLNYYYAENLSKAAKYFQETALMAQKIKDDIRFAKATGNLALIKKENGDYKSAISLLQKDIAISQKNKSDQNTIYASILLAKSFITDNNYQEAEIVLKTIEGIIHSKRYFEKSELDIIKLKLAILKHYNKTENELLLRRRMLDLEDSVNNKDGDIAIIKANWVIQKNKFQKNLIQSDQKIEEASTMKNLYAFLIILILVFSIIVFFLYRKKQKTKLLTYEKRAQDFASQKLQTEQKLHETYETLNDQLINLKEKNVQINKLNVEMVNRQKSPSYYLERSKGNIETLLQSHLMTDEKWINFKKEFQKEYPEFYQFIHINYPEITDSNKRILLLHKLDFNNNEIAELLGVTPDAVKKSKQRLKKKLGDKFDILFDNSKFPD
ncbi:tetratricopeptide repeat protein [Flavobacterium algicola]|uniref:tetratricopeptide repeat protein n=1 Tax=Flavobacterium algicola TaxID=556529 RepID=UPI001EFE82B4|nr:tetratricopeptide repeat protein [Flavobacterium algicola]MCG9790845.1 tetratricopeptide repeat protein [Flavobacterium algicola]